jgi:hypothetical protein
MPVGGGGGYTGSYIIADRVKQKCSVIGTGVVTLGNSILSFKQFSDVAADGDRFHYMLVNINTGEWETGLGMYNATGPTITRSIVTASSYTANAPVPFTGGEKEIMIALLSSDTVIKDDLDRLMVGSDQVTADSLLDGVTNRFYSDTLARGALSAGDNITYDSATGEISLSTDITVAGDFTVTGDTVLNGNLTVNGTTTTVNSEVTTLENPIIALGGEGPLVIDDGVDRGVQFRYYKAGDEKIGFFGWQHDTDKMIYIPDATVTAGEYSGTMGKLDFRVSQPGLVLERITTNYTLAPGEGISVDTTSGSVDINLPSSPVLNDTVIVADGGGDKVFKPAYIRRNGATINGVADDLMFNVPLTRLSFVYDSTTWRMTHA